MNPHYSIYAPYETEDKQAGFSNIGVGYKTKAGSITVRINNRNYLILEFGKQPTKDDLIEDV